MWIDVAQTVFDGLMVGGLYATVAVGITLVFGIMGILNFAHGQMVMLGAYIAFFAVTAGFGFWVGLLLAMAAMGLFGLILERLIFRHTLTDHMTGLTVSLGIIMVVENLAAALFTPDHRNFDPPLSGSVHSHRGISKSASCTAFGSRFTATRIMSSRASVKRP